MLLDGELKMTTFTDAMVQWPEARRLMQRVRRLYIQDNFFYSGIAGCNDITVVTRSGQFEVREDRVPESRAWPMMTPEREVKFMDCASPILGDITAAELLKKIIRMDTTDNIHLMMKATIPN
jgi:hypothetical protein